MQDKNDYSTVEKLLEPFCIKSFCINIWERR